MNMKSKKGYVLVFAAIFAITLMVAAWGLWTYVTHLGQEVKVEEYRSTQGYYAAIAGLRYAYLLLHDPAALGLDPADTPGEQCIIPRTGNAADIAFFAAIDVDLSNLTITITEEPTGDYSVEATAY